MNECDGRMKPFLSVVARLDDNRPETRVNNRFGFSIQFSSRKRYDECFTSVSFVLLCWQDGCGVNGADRGGSCFPMVGNGIKCVNELIAIGLQWDLRRHGTATEMV